MKHSFFARRSFAIALAMAFLLPFIGMGTRRALESNRNDVKDWLPADFPETKTHRWFQEHFPHEQFILASWEGCTLDDERLELLTRKLLPPEDARPADQPWYFKSVLSGQRLVEEMRAHYPDLEEEELFERLEGSLIGDDHYRTCLIVTLSEEAHGKNLGDAVEKIRELARDCDIEPPKRETASNPVARVFTVVGSSVREMIFGREPKPDGIRLGGPPIDNVSIDQEGERTLYRLAILSAIVGLGISWLCFRSVRLTLLVFVIALLAAGIGLATVYFTGREVDAILLSMPSLVYVLAMSGAVHIVNYYHDSVREHGLEGALERALRHGMLPCTLAAVTTALGLGSLLASHLVPINKFGVYSAWGVLATLGLLFLYLPACLHYLPSREYVRGGAKNPDGQAGPSVYVRFWHAVGEFVTRHNRLVTVSCLVLMAVLVLGLFGSSKLGLPGVQTSVKLMKLFSPDAPIIDDYAWLEDQLGPLVPMEIVIHVDNQSCNLSMVDRMRLAKDVEEAVEGLADVGGALSAATLAPDITPDTRKGGVLEKIIGLNRRRERDRLLSKVIEEHRQQFQEYLTVDEDVAVAQSQSDPNLQQLGIGGEIAERLAANELLGLQDIQRHGNLQSIDGLGPQQADEVAQAIDAWHATHHDPNLEELGIPDELAQRLRNADLNSLLDIEQYGKKPTVEQNLATIRSIDSEQAAQVAQAIHDWRTTHGEELWRVSARVAALGDVDYGAFVDELKHRVEPVLAKYRNHPGYEGGVDGIHATYTGLVPLVYKAQRELLHGLYNSLLLAFVLIAIVMMLVLRSPAAGLMAMIPNVFPVILIFGTMAWLEILVDVGTMMTASVALGVAVDDTIHFLTWFRRGLDEGHDRKGAVMLAYERCGTAMSQTTLIGGLGLSVFAFSTFTPTQRFGILMLTLLAAALVGDLVFLPAILSGPAGRCFRASKKKHPDEPPAEGPPSEIPDEEIVAVPIPASLPPRHLRREPPHRSTRAS